MLNKFKLFNGLSSEDSLKVEKFFNKIRFAKKQTLQFPGALQDYIYLVVSGRVKVSYLSPDGKEIIVTILHPGDMYSLHSEASTTVIEAAEIWYIGSDQFKTIIMNNPGMTVNLIKILGSILKNTNDALLNLAFKEVNSRLASLLLKIANEKGIKTGDCIVVELGLTHEDIANLISSTRQTVTTILNRFEKSGLVKTAKKKLIIKDVQKLTELSM